MILVVGATGYLGMEVCRRLSARGEPIRALVRASSDPARRDQLRALGAALAYGDLEDPVSLAAACAGVKAVITSASSIASRVGTYIASVDLQGQRNLIDAAQAAHAGQFIFVSLSPNMSSDTPLNRAKRAIEAHLQASGLPYTIIRPSFFMEYWLSPIIGLDWPNRRAMIFGSGDARISWITIGDVAECVARSVDNPVARDAIIQIGGPAALSPNEAVKLFESAMGKFEIQYVPEAALEAQRTTSPDAHAQSVAGLSLDFAHGDVIDGTTQRAAFPFALTTVEQYVSHLS
jgi:uncharacterized protein YbjT (DUF2867 family)